MTASATQSPRAPGRARKVGLQQQLTCPNCWHVFGPQDVLFIARHESLLGDLVAGPDALMRFRPSRFTTNGDALDPMGVTCSELACPRCHLAIPRPLIEMKPLFVSIVGSPGSGKSFFLTASTWMMRRSAMDLGLSFSDGDAGCNLQLHRSEEALFMAEDPEVPVTLDKTQLAGGDLYQTVLLDGQPQTFPRPFQFTLAPTDVRARPDFPYRGLVLYDNAGEHFQPGQDTAAAPVTLHLSRSAAIFFIFDPTQDVGFRREQVREKTESGQESTMTAPSLTRQEVIFHEMAGRVRQYRGLSQDQAHDKPLVMVLAKADTWFDDPLFADEPLLADPGRLDHPRINQASDRCRQLLLKHCPQMVQSAEAFSHRVIYVPVSSVGTPPVRVGGKDSRVWGVKPRDIRPQWVTVPLLWTLDQSVPGMLAGEPETQTPGGDA